MGVAQKFSSFCSNIQISTDNVSKISNRYKQITKRLNLDFYGSDSEVNHSLYVGSYGRDTDIHVSDIDMLFVLPYAVYDKYNKYQGNGQSALLQAVRTSLQKTYSTSFIGGDGQVVKINFSDGIKFEIVPCFINNDKSYTFPDSNNNGSWKTTNPKPEIETINQANQLYNKNLKRLCQMARAWKDTWSVPMGGLLIDTLAYNFMKSWQYNDKSFLYYDLMSRDFFEYLKNQDANQKYWRAVGSNQYVFRKGAFEYKALRCFNLAKEAIKLESDGYEHSADLKWREIYGTKF
jgi:hypothetical protein